MNYKIVIAVLIVLLLAQHWLLRQQNNTLNEAFDAVVAMDQKIIVLEKRMEVVRERCAFLGL
jgi:hypothetical protein